MPMRLCTSSIFTWIYFPGDHCPASIKRLIISSTIGWHCQTSHHRLQVSAYQWWRWFCLPSRWYVPTDHVEANTPDQTVYLVNNLFTGCKKLLECHADIKLFWLMNQTRFFSGPKRISSSLPELQFTAYQTMTRREP